MNKKMWGCLTLWFVLFFFMPITCNPSKVQLKTSPDFAQDARLYHLKHPIMKPYFTVGYHQGSETKTVLVEDAETGRSYEIAMHFLPDPQEQDFDYAYDVETGEFVNADDVAVRRIIISNPADSSEYVIAGKVNVYKEYENETYSSIRYPIELNISQENETVGYILIRKEADWDSAATAVEFTIHDRIYELNFQEILNKRKVTVKENGQLMAFFDLKPAAFISTSFKGDALIRSGTTNNLTSELFMTYVISCILNKSLGFTKMHF